MHPIQSPLIASSLATLAALGFDSLAIAQPIPSSETIRPAPERIQPTIPEPAIIQPLPPDLPQSDPPPSLIAPPLPQLPEGDAPPNSTQVLIQRIEVLGSTVLQGEIATLTQPLLNTKVSFEQLVNLRSAITQLYLDNGYLTSGAFLVNNPDLSQGFVQIQVIEGELERVDITGLTRLREPYIRSRMALAGTTPLNRSKLERGLQLLQLDPLLQQVNAELTAGSAPGRSILRLSLKEAPAFSAGIEGANNQAPSLGSLQGTAFAGYANLTGLGDRIDLDYGRTEGLTRYEIRYTIPFNPLNGTFSVRYGRNDSTIVENPFRDLDIRSQSETFSVALRQPLIRKPQTEFALGASLDLRRSQTFLLDDIPFSFSEGSQNGETRVAVIRIVQDWVDRNSKRVLAARSQFSLGINAFDATINDSGGAIPDGQFFAWIGQFQWVQQWSPRFLSVARIDTQLSPDRILSLEQFSLGGVDTVRGYRQNQLVADNGLIASLELRFPLTRDPRILQLTPFIEVGTGWNNRSPNPSPQVIAGLGTGLRWQITPALNLRLDYGFPLVASDDRGDFLQEQGFYFSTRYQPF